MIFSKKSHDGELFVDHRASPGLPERAAFRLGYHPSQVKEGAVFETACYSCSHCQTVVVMNPLRTRERGWCSKCDQYICDGCNMIRQETGYVHTSVKEIADLVHSGKFTMSGSMGRPILKPTGD
jgi:hypothetical protein